jgi:tetratricopeptide (TPR) repeat protein
LWELQRLYYSSKGVDAWRRTEVPHHITNNVVIANTYAEMVFALLRDQDRLAPQPQLPLDPIHICELGAGSGRFAFHFLQRLRRICEEGRVDPRAFRYVLTDQAEANLQFWLTHPRFQPFFESGLLDVALFEAGDSRELSLRVSGKTIVPGGLARPVVVVANYFLDTIPQDVFRIDEQGLHHCLVSLFLDKDPRKLSIAQILSEMELFYEYEPAVGLLYEEPWLQNIVEGYRRELTTTHFTIPATGLRCLRRIQDLSKVGLMLLSADKGNHRFGSLGRKPAPELALHGSFSLGVNYHAIKTRIEQSGGVALFPEAYHSSVSVNCSLMLPEAADHSEVRQAYRRHVADFGPDDFASIVSHAKESVPRMTSHEIMSHLRLTHYDGELFARLVTRLVELAPEFNEAQRAAFLDAIERVWDLYFPLGERMNLANGIGCLLFKMSEYALARTYFETSIASHGDHAEALMNVALCCARLEQWDKTKLHLEKILASDPGNKGALELMETCVAHEQEQKS